MSPSFEAFGLTGAHPPSAATVLNLGSSTSRSLVSGSRSNSNSSTGSGSGSGYSSSNSAAIGTKPVTGPSELLYATDSRAFSGLVQLLKATADQEHWLLDIVLKRTSGIHRAIASEQKKIVTKSAGVLGTSATGEGVVSSQ